VRTGRAEQAGRGYWTGRTSRHARRSHHDVTSFASRC
jgi:hypothetical protein